MDGSSKNFVDAIKDIGFNISDQPIRIIKIDKKITLRMVKSLFLLNQIK